MPPRAGSERVRSGLSQGLEYAGLGLLALLVSGPFLLPFHTEPIPSFWGEWWAAILGLCASVMILLADRRLEVSWLHGVAAILLLVLLLQLIGGRIQFLQIGLIYAAYILWGSLLATLGQHLRVSGGMARLSLALATGFSVGSTIAAMIGLAQWFDVTGSTGWILPGKSGGISGNLAQANHYAHYLWLGIASSYYLYWSGRIPRALYWNVVVLLVMASALSGSRSILAYPLVIAASVHWAHRKSPDIASRSRRLDAFALFPALVLLSLVGSSLSQYMPTPPTLSVERLYKEISGASVRVALARAAIPGILEHPLLGIGIGNFPWASFQAAATRMDGIPVKVAEHTHNIVLQLLVDFGIPATVGVACLIGLWAWRLFAEEWSAEVAWCLSILGIGLVHSLVEYPLWYSYFLAPTAILLGATSTNRPYTVGGMRAVAYLAGVFAIGLLILGQLRLDFVRIEAAIYRPLSAHSEREHAWRFSMSQLHKVHRTSLLGPWALLAFAEADRPSHIQADARATICQRSVRFTPARSLLIRCAVQLAISGEVAEATRIAIATLAAFPNDKAATRRELLAAMEQYPQIGALIGAIDAAGPQGGQRL